MKGKRKAVAPAEGRKGNEKVCWCCDGSVDGWFTGVCCDLLIRVLRFLRRSKRRWLLKQQTKHHLETGSAVTESPLGGSFYVNTQSNVWKGFTLKYSLEPLEGANSSDTIPVKVSAVVDTTPLDDVAVGDSTVSNQVLLTVDSGVTTETTTHSAQITVSASEANWATLHPADTYSATMTFTVTAN
ncbi:MAG: hypothetical protein LKE39_03420 [Sphaerochaeta sp.]|nr:hypothetical protein [Sphaerochaeta sp.]